MEGNKANKNSDPRVQQLLREGIAASKMGDKVTARVKLQEVVALDQYSEMGWFWLAAVVESDEEKRACLGNVVVINPNNERAQRLLDRLTDATVGLTGPVRDDLSTGRPSLFKDRRIILIAGAIAVLLVIMILVLVAGQGSTTVQPTVGVIAVEASSQTTASEAATENATAAPTIAAVVRTLPPTWTPSPESNSSGGPTPLASPPSDLIGGLVAAQGGVVTEGQGLSIVTMDPYGKNIRKVSQEDVGDYGIFTPDGQRIIYSRFLAGTNSQQLRAMSANGTQGTELSTLWKNTPPLANMQMPSIARSGATMFFSAISITENDGTPDIYMIPATSLPPFDMVIVPTPVSGEVTEAPTQTPTLIGAGGNAPTEAINRPTVQLTRVTVKDSGNNTWPSASPDGNSVIFVKDSKPLGEDAVDLYVIEGAGGTPRKLTSDGLANVEAAPEWAPDSKSVAYQSKAQDAKSNDIMIINIDGSNPVKLTNGAGDNIRPHWSPDGKYLAFSSNRSGKWQIYIMDVATKTLYQATTGNTNSICTFWGAR